MTPLIGVGISSVLGALLFWVAGYLMARARAVQPAPALHPGGDPSGLGRLESELRAREQEVQHVRREIAELRQARPAPDPQIDTLRGELAGARKELAGMHARLEQARAQQEQARQQLARTEQQLQLAQQQIATLEQAAPDAPQKRGADPRVAQLESRLAHASDQLQQAGELGTTLSARVGKLELELSQSTTERDKLAAQARQLAARLEATGARDEQDRGQLQAAIVERDEAIAQLRAANARLEQERKDASERLAGLSRRQEESDRELHRAGGELQQAQNQLEQAQSQLEQVRQGLRQRELALERAQQELAQAQDRSDELAARLAAATETEGALRRELEQARRAAEDLDDYRSRLAAADNKLEQLRELQEERYALREEIAELRQAQSSLADLDKLDRERRDLAVQVGVLRQKEQQVDALQEERAQLLDALEHHRRLAADLTARTAELEVAAAERIDLAVKLQLLAERAQDMEELRAENDQLKVAASEANMLRRQVAEHQAEAASLRSQAVVAQAPPELPTVTASTGFSGLLDRLLRRLASSQNARSAAVADDIGLLVSGVGPEAEALAALSAVFTQVGSRAEMLLPMATVRQVTIVDENKVTFTAQPLQTELGTLVVATLSVGSGPDAVTLEHALRESEQQVEAT